MTMPSISVVVPTYNEADNLAWIVGRLREALLDGQIRVHATDVLAVAVALLFVLVFALTA